MKIIFLLFLITGLSEAFDKDDLLAHCGTTYIARSYFSRILKCIACRNVKISEAETESFVTEKFNILNEECVVFKNSNLGVVNGDFFKQFPRTKVMIMIGVDLSLRRSENLLVNPNLKYLEIQLSEIKDNNQTNAFHSLIDLRSLTLDSCYFENTTIDSELLRMNSELRELRLDLDMPSTNLIADDAFVNLINLKKMSISVFNISRLPDTFFKEKPELKSIELIGALDKFPQDLPVSLESLVMQYAEFRSLTKEDLLNLKNLSRLSLTEGSLAYIESNAFDDLENLGELDLRLNEIKNFSERHLRKNGKIWKVLLMDNPLEIKDLPLGHGLEEHSRGRFYNY